MQNSGIVCRGVGKKYGNFTALKSVDVEINVGDFIALFGPNGAGKTTFMKIICGLSKPSSGRASVGSLDVNDSEVRKKVGVISHKSFLYDNLTALENLVFYGELYEVSDPRKRGEDLLESVELLDRKDDFSMHFSRGMIQRLSIARALVADPDFVFLDEPFTGLDQHSSNLFKELLQALHRRGKTVVMITHDIPAGIEIATRAIILKKGEKIFDSPTDSLTVDGFKQLYAEKVGA